jgi:hypothetical protein
MLLLLMHLLLLLLLLLLLRFADTGAQSLARHLAHIVARLGPWAGAMQGCLSVGDAVWLARRKGAPQEL